MSFKMVIDFSKNTKITLNVTSDQTTNLVVWPDINYA